MVKMHGELSVWMKYHLTPPAPTAGPPLPLQTLSLQDHKTKNKLCFSFKEKKKIYIDVLVQSAFPMVQH